MIALRNESDEIARTVAYEQLALIAAEDRYTGNHAAVVMAPFMWSSPSRFSAGLFGVLYTAAVLETAIREAAFHAAELLGASEGSPPGVVPRVAMRLDLDERRHVDVRWIADEAATSGRRLPGGVDERIYDPDPAHYAAAQTFGQRQYDEGADGIAYSSVRDEGGTCFATFRPAAVRSVQDTATTIELVWNGTAFAQYNIVETHAL